MEKNGKKKLWGPVRGILGLFTGSMGPFTESMGPFTESMGPFTCKLHFWVDLIIIMRAMVL